MHSTMLLTALLVALCGTVAGDVYQPDTAVDAHVWTGANAPGFVYPEQSNTAWGMPSLINKPSFGVALSGGGFRAATCALGWVRALHDMGYLNSARYLSSNSGGSWLNGAFSYTQVPANVFLGPSVAPGNLTTAAFEASLTPNSFGSVIRNATIIGRAITGVIADLFIPNDRAQVGGWSNAVGTAFLDPFDVGVQSSTITTLGTRGRVHERIAAAYPDLTVLTATTNKPFPLILGSLLLADDPQQFFPCDFTPLGIGVPALYNSTNPKLGAGFVEPIGFNSQPPGTPPTVASPNGSQVVTVQPLFTVPLVTIVGISSSFVAQGTSSPRSSVQALSGAERLLYWNQQDYTGERVAFADGGGIDNTAIIPMLRRGVRTIIACIATITSPVNRTSSQWAVSQYDVAALWGATPLNETELQDVNGVGPAKWNQMIQVFPTSGYQEFYDVLQQRVAAGQTPYVRAQYEVLDNPLQAVHGGFTVDILFVLNMATRDWEAKLPSATRQLLADSRAQVEGRGMAELRDFPYISTYDADYDAATTTLLNQLSDHNMRQLNSTIAAMLAAASGARTG